MRRALLSTLLVYSFASGASFEFEPLTGQIVVRLDGKPLTTFHYDPKWDKPFLYPIRTVSGLTLSRGWPVEPRPGEQEDHPWHRGIWWGHGDINGEDFWREKPDLSTSRLVADGKPKTADESLDVKLAMITSKGKRIGSVSHRYIFRRDQSNLLIDVTITVSADRGEALRFGDTEDGGFAFRLADEFRQDRGARMINSEGQVGTEQMWGRSARWTDYSASINGRLAGVAILDHSENIRHPTRWHARGYSLNSANPFGLADFTGDKANDGGYTLPAGRQMSLRYRIVVHEGEQSRYDLERHFKSFSSK